MTNFGHTAGNRLHHEHSCTFTKFTYMCMVHVKARIYQQNFIRPVLTEQAGNSFQMDTATPKPTAQYRSRRVLTYSSLNVVTKGRHQSNPKSVKNIFVNLLPYNLTYWIPISDQLGMEDRKRSHGQNLPTISACSEPWASWCTGSIMWWQKRRQQVPRMHVILTPSHQRTPV